MSFASPRLAPSHQIVQCGYCNQDIRRDKLKNHVDKFHSGLPRLERGQKTMDGKSAQDLLQKKHDREREALDQKRALRDKEEAEERAANLKAIKDTKLKLEEKKAQQAAEEVLQEKQKEEAHGLKESEAKELRLQQVVDSCLENAQESLPTLKSTFSKVSVPMEIEDDEHELLVAVSMDTASNKKRKIWVILFHKNI